MIAQGKIRIKVMHNDPAYYYFVGEFYIGYCYHYGDEIVYNYTLKDITQFINNLQLKSKKHG